jgi:hypothetical protein
MIAGYACDGASQRKDSVAAEETMARHIGEYVRDAERKLPDFLARRVVRNSDNDQAPGSGCAGAVTVALMVTVPALRRDAVAPGSYLVLCHGTAEGKPAVVRAAGKVFNRSVATKVASGRGGDDGFVWRLCAGGSRTCACPAVAARLLRRRAQRSEHVLVPGRDGTKPFSSW